MVATAAREPLELEALAADATAADTTNLIQTVVADVTCEEDCARDGGLSARAVRSLRHSRE